MGKLVLPLATSTERLTITPEAGELLYDETLDKTFEGDGTTVGGNVLGSGGASLSIPVAFGKTSFESLSTTKTDIIFAPFVITDAEYSFDGTSEVTMLVSGRYRIQFSGNTVISSTTQTTVRVSSQQDSSGSFVDSTFSDSSCTGAGNPRFTILEVLDLDVGDKIKFTTQIRVGTSAFLGVSTLVVEKIG